MIRKRLVCGLHARKKKLWHVSISFLGFFLRKMFHSLSFCLIHLSLPDILQFWLDFNGKTNLIAIDWLKLLVNELYYEIKSIMLLYFFLNVLEVISNYIQNYVLYNLKPSNFYHDIHIEIFYLLELSNFYKNIKKRL